MTRCLTRPLNRLALILTFTLAAVNAQASHQIDIDIGISSDFMRDGISQNSDGTPSLQLGSAISHSSGFYGGIWATSIDSDDTEVVAEVDGYLGYYRPINAEWALDLSSTFYKFIDNKTDIDQDYIDIGAKVLWRDALMVGVKNSDSWYNRDVSRRIIETAYTFQRDSFAIELYLAQHQLDQTNEVANFGAGEDSYFHFRLGLTRTYGAWDYRFNVDRTNLGSEFDAGTNFSFSLHRYFNLK